MGNATVSDMAEYIHNSLRLKTFPIAVKFLEDVRSFPPKARRPSEVFQKKITVCQCVTLARTYGWTVGLAREDLACVPALLAFGLSSVLDPSEGLSELFCAGEYAMDLEGARAEAASMCRLENGEYGAIALSPLRKELYDPDVVVLYGNTAQIMRLIQALVYEKGRRISGEFGGKVECSEYLIAPFKLKAPRVAVPGMGDRIFSMTQDDELILSIPGDLLADLVHGLKESGRVAGARYPVTFYQNFEPEFPNAYIQVGKKLGIL